MLLLVMLDVPHALIEIEDESVAEGEPEEEKLALEENELLRVAHGEGERVRHSLTVRLSLALPLAAAVGETESVLEVDRLADTVPQAL